MTEETYIQIRIIELKAESEACRNFTMNQVMQRRADIADAQIEALKAIQLP